MMLNIFLILSSTLFAAITNVRVEPTPTQAVIRYVAPDTAACSVLVYDMNRSMRITNMVFSDSTVTVTTALTHVLTESQEIYLEGTGVPEWDGQRSVLTVLDNTNFVFPSGDTGASTSGNIGVLVHDTNDALFANSHLDSRFGNNNSGREFIVGQRKTEISGGKAYSRALQVFSRHRYVISCGADTYTGEFMTKNIPLGALAVDRPVPAAPGESAWPSLDKSARWDKPNLVFLDQVIDPITGVMYTQMYPPEIATDTSYGLSTTNTPTPVGTNWTNPGNVRTQDATSATYSAATKDILCVKPHLVTLANSATKSDWLTQIVSLENLTATVRASGAAATQADRDLEIALNINGDCSTPATEWKTLSPSGSLADVSFPTGTPKGGFADWHSATQRRLIHSDVVTRRGFVNTSGTAATSAASGSWLSLFNTNWGTGATVRIGGTAGGTCADGTEYTVSSVQSPRDMTLSSSAGTQTGAFWCAPSFALMLRKKSTSTDSISVDYVNFSLRTTNIPATHNSGSAKIFSEKPVTDGDGNVGYLSYSTGSGGTTWTIHWVSKDNGESRSIMGHLVNLPGQAGADGWASGICGATENSFISTDPESFVCAMTGNSGGQVLVKFTMNWSGTGRYKSQTISFVPWSSCTTTSPPSPNPCLSAVNLHAGYTLTELIQDRNPEFDPAKFATCGVRGVQTHLILIPCGRGPQDTIGWYTVFDMSKPIASYNPSDQSTNPLIGALNPTHSALRGWGVYHTGWVLPGSEQYVLFDPKFGRKNSATNDNGAGPWAMRIVSSAAINTTTDVTSCPANQWNHTNCSTIHVTSQPIDPDPGAGEAGTAGEYGNMAVGNGVRFFKCDSGASAYTHETITENVANTGCQTYANDEYGRILEISGTAPDITLTVARGITSTGMKSHVSGYSLYQWPMTDYNAQLVDINVIWDVLNAPTGSETHVKYARTNTSHGAMTSHALVGYGLTGGYDQLAWINPTLETLVQDPQVDLGLPSSVWPAFAGRYGLRFAGTIQRYAANNHTDFDSARETAYQFYLDSRPFMAAPGNDVRPAFSKIGGTSYLYKYEKQVDESSVPTYFKHLPYLVYVQGRVLLEKSGPDVTLADTSTDWWKFCLAYRADECRTGSTPGDVYVNSPYMNLTNNALYTCLGGISWEEADICAGHLDPVIGPSIQFWFGSGPNMARGRHIRKLGWGLQEYKLFGQVPKIFPTGEWAGPLWTNFLNSHRSGGLMMKLPPIPPEDGIDRTTFVPMNVSVGSVPAGTSIAQVEFGYNDFGTPAQLYCTARQESCLATTDKVIGDATITSQWTTSNTNATWQYINSTTSATTPITVTTTSAHKFTNDLKVRASSNTSGLNSKLWPINVTGSTTFELVGSTSGDVGASSTQRVFVFKEDPPFAFSGESFSVASASNASPIEIGTTTAHRFRTGSRVCITGVGGNTAANGCWAITATGPSVFTLDGSTGNGTYTSGGTVTLGGVACISSCTVAIPGVTGRVLHYRWRYLNSSGTVIATGSTQTTVVP